MKLRDIIESYTGLPDEDEFLPDQPICVACERPIEEWGTTCDCEADFCQKCLDVGRFEFPEDYKFEKRGIGWSDEMGLRQAYEQGDPMPLEYEALIQCPECRYKARPFAESYEGLLDEDDFGEYQCECCGEPNQLHMLWCWATDRYGNDICERTICIDCIIDDTIPHDWSWDPEEHERTGGGSFCPEHPPQCRHLPAVRESYEGLPDEDHFSHEVPECQGCHSPEVSVGPLYGCNACGGLFCDHCMPVHYSFGADYTGGRVGRVWRHCPGAETIVKESYAGLPDEDEFVAQAPQEVEALFGAIADAKVYGEVWESSEGYDIRYFNNSDVDVTDELIKHPAFEGHDVSPNYEGERSPWVLTIYSSIDELGNQWIINHWLPDIWELTTL